MRNTETATDLPQYDSEPSVVQAEIVPPAPLDSPIDPQTPAPHGEPCEFCGTPVDSDDRFCPGCGAALSSEPVATVVAEQPIASRSFECHNCGSEITSETGRRSLVCPFCESTYVVEKEGGRGDREDVEFVIGFSITPDDAYQRFRQWIQDNSWFRPGDLRRADIEQRVHGVYIPFWWFSMLARSEWAAQIGEYWYRTETYVTRDSKGKMVTRTRTVRETEWWPLSGRHHSYHSGYLVSGSKGLAQAEADAIKPFDLPAMKRYRPHYLAGWDCEEYSVSREQALEICKQVFLTRERSAVAAFLPGDEYRNLRVSTRFEQVNSDLCLLPVYIFNYRYRGRPYRIVVNGQTGKIVGKKPISRWRIAVAVIVALAIVGGALLAAGLSGAF